MNEPGTGGMPRHTMVGENQNHVVPEQILLVTPPTDRLHMVVSGR